MRAEPGSGLAPSASPTLEGRKEGRMDRREEEGEEAWSLQPSGEGRLGFRGLPQEASSAPASISNKELRAAFMFGQAGLSPGHSGTRAKAQRGVRSHRRTSQHHLPGGPQQPQDGRQGCLPHRGEEGERPREGLGPTQGHTESDSPPPANPRSFLFSPGSHLAGRTEGGDSPSLQPSPGQTDGEHDRRMGPLS